MATYNADMEFIIETIRFDRYTLEPILLGRIPKFAANLEAAKEAAWALKGTLCWHPETEGFRIKTRPDYQILYEWPDGT